MESEAALPVVGLATERRRLLEALRRGESLALLGPRGCGKTTAIQSALDSMPAVSDIIYVRYSPVLHELLVSSAGALLHSGHGYLERVAPKNGDPAKWLSHQTSVHLRGILWNALEAEPRTIILDGVEGASYPIFRFLQRLYFAPGMVMFSAARDAVALGALSRLFWHPQKVIRFKPLSEVEAAQLFDMAIECFRLRHLDVDEFRHKVLEAAGGNPGQIVEMCRLAMDPQYVTGKYIKFAPLRIDAMVKFLS